MESRKNARFMVTRSEVRNLAEVTSRLISKLYKLYTEHCGPQNYTHYA